MTTLFTMTLELARLITNVREGNATAVSATSITDSGAAFMNGLWQGGTLWLHDTTPVTKLVELSGVDKVTFATGTVPTALVRYSLANKDYPRDTLRLAINQAIKDLHPSTAEDATLTTTADQLEYSLPTGVSDLLKVEVEYYHDTTQKYYYEHHNWREVGSKLRFLADIPCSTGLYIRLTYRAYPADLTTDAGVIPANIDGELLKWKAACHALRWGLEQYGQDANKRIVERLNEAQAEVARRGGNKRLVQKSTIFSGW